MIKRFYKEVSIEKDESSDAFKVLCDGKPLKNMKGNVILIPSETLALKPVPVSYPASLGGTGQNVNSLIWHKVTICLFLFFLTHH